MNTPIYSIQALRGFAALSVLWLHACYKDSVYSNGDLTGLAFGNIGVDMFFIISGFIMLHSIKPTTNPYDFILKRLIRIYPFYWLTSLIALIGYFFAPNLVNSGRESDLLSTFFLLPTEVGYLNPNAWTLSFEIYFYSILFFCLILNFRLRVFLSTIVILSLAVFGAFLNPISNWGRFLSNSILFEFVFGFILYYIYVNFIRGNKFTLLWSILSLLALYIPLDALPSERFIQSGIPAFFICLFIVSLESIFELKPVPLLMKLGDSSYSLYLVHAFVLSGFSFIFSKIPLIINNSYVFVALLVVISIFLGYLCFILVERPLTKLVLNYYINQRNRML